MCAHCDYREVLAVTAVLQCGADRFLCRHWSLRIEERNDVIDCEQGLGNGMGS